MKTGALRNPIDKRDIRIASFQAPVDIPKKYETDVSKLPIWDQQETSSCVGHALAKLVQLLNLLDEGKVVDHSPRYIYANAKKIDGIPNDDGTYPRVGASIVVGKGVATRKTVSDDPSVGETIYKSYTPDAIADNEAKQYKARGYAMVDIEPMAICQAIYQNKGVVGSLSVGNWRVQPVKPGSEDSLHYTIWYGYEIKKDKTIIKGINSWGKDWGKLGKFTFVAEEHMPKIYDVIAVTDIPNNILEEARAQYKWFSQEEVAKAGLEPKFMKLLDKAREVAGIPFRINSGRRSQDTNENVGGVKDSAHLSGLAADIKATTGQEAYAIIKAAMSVGIQRIGLNRDAGFVHLDIDETKPRPTIWTYSSKAPKAAMQGYKTYTGIAITLISSLVGFLGMQDVISSSEITEIIMGIGNIVGIAMAIYGRYNAEQRHKRAMSVDTMEQ